MGVKSRIRRVDKQTDWTWGKGGGLDVGINSRIGRGGRDSD